MTFKELGSRLPNHSIRGIRWKANKLGIKKISEVNPERLSLTQWAYMGGLLDGEGTVIICRQINKGYLSLRARIGIGMTGEKTIKKVMGWLETAGFHPTYNILRNRHRIKKMHVVNLNRLNEIVVFLENVLYLTEKQAQRDLVIEFCKSRLSSPNRTFKIGYSPREIEICDEVKRLNGNKTRKVSVKCLRARG